MKNTEGQLRDIVIIGGGVLGLWSAEYALRAGRKVTVLEAREIGSGASGGILGALMPHQPVGWSAKKALQYDGLTRLPQEIAQLEKATGLKCYYRRPGRVMPIRKEGQKIQSHLWAEGALVNWPEMHGMKPEWHVEETRAFPNAWYDHSFSPLGVNRDTLSACVDPRALLKALASSIRGQGGEIVENCAVESFDEAGKINLKKGKSLQAEQIIISAGYESFPMVEAFIGEDLGTGVKGQSVILKTKTPVDPSWPVIYDNGLYVIARPDGNVAVGSTSEKSWTDANQTDEQINALIARAKAVSPILNDAEILEAWAGVRPQTHTRKPYFGQLSTCQQIFLLTGGFKITLGIAHVMAEKLVGEMCKAS